MINKYIVLAIGIFLLNNILIWYQLNSQLVWDWAKGTKSMWIMSLLGVPISLMFWYATKIGYEGFATSMLTFPVMTWLYLGEAITLKTLVTILLAFIIMLLQLL